MKVLVQNQQTLRRADRRRVAALVRRFMDWAGAGRNWNELAVRLLDDRGIAETNRAYLDASRATDVMAFALRPMPGCEARAGQILVNVQRAVEAGRRRAGADAELALYLAHGCDHLAGGRDHTPALRRAMLRRETQWVRQAARQGGLGLLREPRSARPAGRRALCLNRAAQRATRNGGRTGPDTRGQAAARARPGGGRTQHP